MKVITIYTQSSLMHELKEAVEILPLVDHDPQIVLSFKVYFGLLLLSSSTIFSFYLLA